MKLKEIYDHKEKKDLIDLIDLIEEVKNDEKNGLILPDIKSYKEKFIFNPLLEEYYCLKKSYLERPEEYSKEIFIVAVQKLIKDNPRYKEAIEYINFTKDNKNNMQDEEDEIL